MSIHGFALNGVGYRLLVERFEEFPRQEYFEGCGELHLAAVLGHHHAYAQGHGVGLALVGVGRYGGFFEHGVEERGLPGLDGDAEACLLYTSPSPRDA